MLDKLFQDIESEEFLAKFSVLSGFSHFVKAMENNSHYKDLVRYCVRNNQSETVAKTLSDRIVYHMANHVFLDAMNPMDSAITFYLSALLEINEKHALTLAKLFKNAENLWYAKKYASLICNSMNSKGSLFVQNIPECETCGLRDTDLNNGVLKGRDNICLACGSGEGYWSVECRYCGSSRVWNVDGEYIESHCGVCAKSTHNLIVNFVDSAYIINNIFKMPELHRERTDIPIHFVDTLLAYIEQLDTSD